MNLRLNSTHYSTLHVNLWGSPGVGKSAVAAHLYAKLKESGFEAVLVQDFANELAIQGRLFWLDTATQETNEYDQLLISSEQYRRQAEWEGAVEVVITDSPLLQQVVFAPENYSAQLLHILSEQTAGWSSVDVMLENTIRSNYSSQGRIRSVEQASALQPEIEKILRAYRPNHLRIDASVAAFELYERIKRHLRPD